MSVASELSEAKACKVGLKWVAEVDNLEDAWNGCPRGDWLLWVVYVLGVNPHLVVQTAIQCARLVADTPPGQQNKRLSKAVVEAKSWKPSDIKHEHVKGARYMVELASHRGLWSPPDLSVLQSMAEIVRQKIPYPLVRAQLAGGKFVRKVV